MGSRGRLVLGAVVAAAVARVEVEVEAVLHRLGLGDAGPVEGLPRAGRDLLDPREAALVVDHDAADPTTIVTDESHTGRNVTLWIVAVKFVLGGGVLLWFGMRRLRRS